MCVCLCLCFVFVSVAYQLSVLVFIVVQHILIAFCGEAKSIIQKHIARDTRTRHISVLSVICCFDDDVFVAVVVDSGGGVDCYGGGEGVVAQFATQNK